MGHDYCVYMLKCKDGSFYTGITNDLKRRLSAHESGKGAKYTRGRGPFALVYVKSFPTKSEALKEELRIKAMKRSEKQELIERENGDAATTKL